MQITHLSLAARLFLKASCLLFLFSFISCGGTDSTTQEPTFKNTDNTVFARLPGEPDKLNPLLTTSTYSRMVYEQIYLYLLHFDPVTLEMKPQLAKARPEKTVINSGPYEGGIAYSYEIIDEAVWDNGSPITGYDMEFTFKAIFNPKVQSAPIRAYLDFIRDIEVDPENAKKFTVYTNEKYIKGEEAINNLPIFPTYVYDADGLMKNIPLKEMTGASDVDQLLATYPDAQTFADQFNEIKFSREKAGLIGAGPYAFEEWETGQRIVLKKKADWWGDDLVERFPLLTAFPDQINYIIMPDQNTALAALKDESIDVTAQIDAKDFTELKENELVQQLFNLHNPISLVYYYVGINNQSPKLADKRVRRALAHLVNVNELIDDLFFGYAERQVGPFHPSKKYYNKALAPIDFNIEKAVALLKEAGWEDTNGNGIVDKIINGETVEMELRYLTSSGSKFGKKTSLLLQDNAKKAGVQINIEAKDFKVLIEDLKKRDYELNGGGWAQSPGVDDPKQIWHSASDTPDGTNRLGFHNDEVDALIDQIRITMDEEERNKMYLRFQEIVYEEQPCIFLIAPQERLAIHKRFEARPTLVRPGFVANEFRQL